MAPGSWMIGGHGLFVMDRHGTNTKAQLGGPCSVLYRGRDYGVGKLPGLYFEHPPFLLLFMGRVTAKDTEQPLLRYLVGGRMGWDQTRCRFDPNTVILIEAWLRERERERERERGAIGLSRLGCPLDSGTFPSITLVGASLSLSLCLKTSWKPRCLCVDGGFVLEGTRIGRRRSLTQGLCVGNASPLPHRNKLRNRRLVACERTNLLYPQ
ncbi:hypothetical protein LZ30DRAFT_131339 [Colletotrichum cereale]|nr:hypothetical protein LZ30DRAFT_131339 [Colletotrichum cereale]